MKKWIIRVLALFFLGILFVILNYIIVEIVGNFTRELTLQDETTKEIYDIIMESNVDISKLRLALVSFEKSSIFGQFAFGFLLCSGIIFVYQSILKLLEKIFYKKNRDSLN